MPAPPYLDVLIVDDHDGMRALLRAVLERAGAGSVREAESGVAGLAAIDAAVPSLILADQRMPEMDGLTFIAHARADARCAATHILLITGHADEFVREAARAAGADGVLGKPVSPRDLLAAIEKLCR